MQQRHDNILYLPEVDANELGIYNASLKLLNPNPITFGLNNLIEIQSTNNPVAVYQPTNGALSVLRANLGAKSYKAEFKTVDANFELVSMIEITATKPNNVPISHPYITKTALINGKIYTVNPQQPWAEAIYIEDGVIKYNNTL